MPAPPGDAPRSRQRVSKSGVISRTASSSRAPRDARPTRSTILTTTAKGNLGGKRVATPIAGHHIPPPPIIQKPCVEVHDFTEDIYGQNPGFDGLLDDPDDESPIQVRAAKISKSVTARVQAWMEYRPGWLDEMTRLDGLGDFEENAPCSRCGLQPGIARCRECICPGVLCAPCLIGDHVYSPLHRVERWNDGSWEPSSLSRLGLRIQLGHPAGEACPSPQAARQDFLVLHVNGVHYLKLSYCSCHGVKPHVQLLRTRWFPPTWDSPRTAITFELLNTFHILTLQAKTSLWDYFQSILRLHDNAGLQTTVFRWNELSFAVRVWRHLKLIKRGGGSYLPGGLDTVARGAFAVECPACPHPGQNLPAGWKTAPENVKWLYALFLAVDACFRLKLKARGFHDVELGSGWAYFVNQDAYEAYLKDYVDEKEMPTCDNAHHAVFQALTRGTAKTVSTGVGGVVCARHVMMLANGVADLQKGERYCNMDYVIGSAVSIAGRDLEIINCSYDIMCSFIVNFWVRQPKLPDILAITRLLLIRAFIPNFHIHGHGPKCRCRYSFHYNRWVGLTHAEGVEQQWSNLGLTATSTREMGPGARHLVLDDHWGSWNWRKRVGLGKHLATHLDNAVEMRDAHRVIADKFSATFPAETVAEWRAVVLAWQRDPDNCVNPFAEPETATTLADIRLEIAAEEDEAIGVMLHEVSPCAFLQTALEIEERQRALKLRVTNKAARTSTQKISIQQLRRSVKCQIIELVKIQSIYMPGVSTVRSNATAQDRAGSSATRRGEPDANADADAEIDGADLFGDTKAEDIPLFLPSALSAASRGACCLDDVADKERRMRLAQAIDAVIELRRLRRVYQGLNARLRQLGGQGQGTLTRARATLLGFRDKLTLCKLRYRAAYSALVRLDAGGDWTRYLKPLADADVSGPGKDDEDVVEEAMRKAVATSAPGGKKKGKARKAAAQTAASASNTAGAAESSTSTSASTSTSTSSPAAPIDGTSSSFATTSSSTSSNGSATAAVSGMPAPASNPASSSTAAAVASASSTTATASPSTITTMAPSSTPSATTPTTASAASAASAKSSRGLPTISWIWTVVIPRNTAVTTEISEQELSDAVRVEWAKTEARAERWTEEVQLLVEEIRRTLKWLEWKAKWWEGQLLLRTVEDRGHASGLRGYARKQARILRGHVRVFAALCVPVLLDNFLDDDWVADYKQYVPPPKAPKRAAAADVAEDIASSDDEEELGLASGAGGVEYTYEWD